jgi:2-oxo-4-hydroxy-4-carboxy-5-ureidoimidazoline decarboxylase
VTLEMLNGLPPAALERELIRCCASPRWAAALAARRPFSNGEELIARANDVWWSLDGGDWLEAFAAHPRIGERAAGWAGDEQAGVRGAERDVLARLNALNHDYERKFGHVFLIFATGKTAAQMLAELERRLRNEPATELRIAAGEQARITRLRLQKLLGDS